jgi:hypothetical protein
LYPKGYVPSVPDYDRFFFIGDLKRLQRDIIIPLEALTGTLWDLLSMTIAVVRGCGVRLSLQTKNARVFSVGGYRSQQPSGQVNV